MRAGMGPRMIRAGTLALGLLLGTAAAAQESADRLQKRVQECATRITERFVFFGGGSGVLISADGHCLTNHHVVQGPQGALKETRVTLFSGKVRFARLVCTDSMGDVALYKIRGDEGETFPFVEWGDSDGLEAGEYVLACGNPFGLALPAEDRKMYPSITLGIVSALHRNQGTYFDCIQTDAAVNPGNSGGPLVTLDGKLVGINGRIATRYFNRVNSGVGYAIPARQIRNFLPDMMKGGENGRVYHGQVAGLSLSAAGTEGAGTRISGIQPGSPAEKAGLKKGDLIVKVEGYPITGRDRFMGAIGTWPMGAEVTLRARRGTEETEHTVLLGRYIGGEIFGWGGGESPPGRARASLGVMVEPGEGGLEVKDVRPASPADEAGLRIGDVILKLDGRAAGTPTEFSARVRSRRPGDRIKLLVRRGDGQVEIEAVLARPPEE